MSDSHPQPSREKIPQLDAVRGLAVLLVMLHNTSGECQRSLLQTLFASGWMGVDLFFVLSGFLITRILLNARQTENYFTNFYARRCLRIWPLYFAVLLLMFVAVPLAFPSAAVFSPRSSPWWAYPLFLQNFLVRIPAQALGALGVTWSLAIEEQFYLVWPWVVKSCSAARLRRIAFAVTCLSPIVRLYLGTRHVEIYSNLFCRLDGLMAGALLAALVTAPGFRPARYVKPAWVSFFVAAVLAVFFDARAGRWLVHSLAVVAAASFIYLALFCSLRWFRAAVTNRFLIYTGTISYGLYLLHRLPIDAAQELHLSVPPFALAAFVLVASYALAALSWNLLERPFLKLKRWFPSGVARLEPVPPVPAVEPDRTGRALALPFVP